MISCIKNSMPKALQICSFSTKSRKTLEIARAAIKHTQTVISLGAGNVPDAKVSAKQIEESRQYMSQEMNRLAFQTSEYPLENYLNIGCDTIAESKVGNCFEYSLIAFCYLKSTHKHCNVFWVELDKADHVFLKIENGSEVVICDPWASQAYLPEDTHTKVSEIHKKQPFQTQTHIWCILPSDLRQRFALMFEHDFIREKIFFYDPVTGKKNLEKTLAQVPEQERNKMIHLIMNYLYEGTLPLFSRSSLYTDW